ncbi:MAG: anhydro-N-acetylmuramic acid kinase [Planctomycetes bacterium]|nr:anhydro-N-acetylmuramic acid kinase [Planctomycetota bacterium]
MTIPRWFIGLASGSGGEGADAVLVESIGIGTQQSVRVLHHLRRNHPRETQDLFPRTLSMGGAASVGDLAMLHRQLGENAAACVPELLSSARVDLNRILAIGHIGPLAWHEPADRVPVSLEIGSTSLIAERTGLTVFGEFRERDLAAGGQGMPITALADWVQFRHPEKPRLLVHLGGTTSIVYLPNNARPQDVVAFEVGPGTRLLDAVIRQASGGRERCDAGGKHAVQGHCIDSLLAEWVRYPYLQRRPPKSLPRSEFGSDWIARAARNVLEAKGSLEDFLCTLSHFLVRCVASSLRWLPRDQQMLDVYLSGGGTRNGLFWRLLEQETTGLTLHRLDDLAVPAQARQAAGAAVLAALTMDGIPASSPGSTGAVGRLLGRVTPGEPRNWARCLRWMAEQTAPELTHPYRAA